MAKEIGPHTDLYSTGVIAYELITGKVPFSNTDTPWAILHAHIYDPPPPLRSLNPDVDPALAAWVEQLLAKEADDRPADAPGGLARARGHPAGGNRPGLATRGAGGNAARRHGQRGRADAAGGNRTRYTKPRDSRGADGGGRGAGACTDLGARTGRDGDRAADGAAASAGRDLSVARARGARWPAARRLLLGIAALVALAVGGFVLAVTVLGGPDESSAQPETTAPATDRGDYDDGSDAVPALDSEPCPHRSALGHLGRGDDRLHRGCRSQLAVSSSATATSRTGRQASSSGRRGSSPPLGPRASTG